MSRKSDHEPVSIRHRALTIIDVICCVILIPILAVNVTLIVKSYMNSSSVPSVGGYLPLIILTDSMYPEFESGDLTLCHTADDEDVVEGDIIAFF